jgi:hypothetical protein
MIQDNGFDLDIVDRVLYLYKVLAAKYVIGPVKGASFAEYGRFCTKYDLIDKLRARIVLTIPKTLRNLAIYAPPPPQVY